jgi:hypothetical protein
VKLPDTVSELAVLSAAFESLDDEIHPFFGRHAPRRQTDMIATGWTRRMMVLGLGGVLIAGCAASLLLSQPSVADTQRTGTPLSNPAASATQADPTTKITPEQEAALVEVRKILQQASEVAQGVVIENPGSKEGKLLANNKRFALRDIVSAQARAGDIEGARLTTTANGGEDP